MRKIIEALRPQLYQSRRRQRVGIGLCSDRCGAAAIHKSEFSIKIRHRMFYLKFGTALTEYKILCII